MESKPHISEGAKRNEAGLMPHSFKRVGIAVMVLSIVPMIFIKATGMDLGPAQRAISREITADVFVLGLLFFAWSKDKVEDEMTVALRLRSMSFAFFWGVLLVVLEPLVNVLFRDTAAGTSARGLVVSMLFFYLILYYLQKRGRWSTP